MAKNDNNDDNIFYTAKNDRAFKEIFTKETNQDLLSIFLETTLDVKINSITYQNIERNQGNIKVRRKNLDVLLDTDHGLIGIEVNAYPKKYLHVRNLAFLCDVYAHYTLVGKEYKKALKLFKLIYLMVMEIKIIN